MCVGRAGVGVDNIDVDAATERGVIVMNTPSGNTIATAELTFTHLLSLAMSYNDVEIGVIPTFVEIAGYLAFD